MLTCVFSVCLSDVCVCCRSSVCLLSWVWCLTSSCRCFSSPQYFLLTSDAWRWELSHMQTLITSVSTLSNYHVLFWIEVKHTYFSAAVLKSVLLHLFFTKSKTYLWIRVSYAQCRNLRCKHETVANTRNPLLKSRGQKAVTGPHSFTTRFSDYCFPSCALLMENLLLFHYL